MKPGFAVTAVLASLIAGTTLCAAAAAPSADLAQLEAQLATLRLRYTDKHPEVIALLQKIKAQRESEGLDQAPATKQQGNGDDLRSARERLQELREMYNDKHPVVVAQKKRVAELEDQKTP